eukprot:CAMPEP_0198578474 /NCGR_PEP_ID=MMETSP1462-20131121/120271_1 /TAXON_ID=1333877 /ORGANISM="Brandtodinium nutriculum, Strain RCC3387" /LENGTH=64 /DNA_ID=CAMNT_0044309775 /DNA_START=10 /DNA_END=201 /DNA_ORIENTATION=+
MVVAASHADEPLQKVVGFGLRNIPVLLLDTRPRGQRFEPVHAGNARQGLRVRRGPDWDTGDQDG